MTAQSTTIDQPVTPVDDTVSRTNALHWLTVVYRDAGDTVRHSRRNHRLDPLAHRPNANWQSRPGGRLWRGKGRVCEHRHHRRRTVRNLDRVVAGDRRGRHMAPVADLV